MQADTATRFYSRKHPVTNTFWENVQQALTDLPGDPKPACKGFYFAEYDPLNGLSIEAIGEIPEDKKFKYMYFATKKVLQTLYKGTSRSQEFMNKKMDQYIGGVIINGYGAGISGHDSLIDEALSVLWLHANKPQLSIIQHENPWEQMCLNAMEWQRTQAYKNPWIEIIGKRMINF